MEAGGERLGQGMEAMKAAAILAQTRGHGSP